MKIKKITTTLFFYYQIASLGVAADLLAKRIKLESFEKITTQDVAFFDREENTVGDLFLYLVDDPVNINHVRIIDLIVEDFVV